VLLEKQTGKALTERKDFNLPRPIEALQETDNCLVNPRPFYPRQLSQATRAGFSIPLSAPMFGHNPGFREPEGLTLLCLRFELIFAPRWGSFNPIHLSQAEFKALS
jgi:hypothetical protein